MYARRCFINGKRNAVWFAVIPILYILCLEASLNYRFCVEVTSASITTRTDVSKLTLKTYSFELKKHSDHQRIDRHQIFIADSIKSVDSRYIVATLDKKTAIFLAKCKLIAVTSFLMCSET